eukprot:COSAG02_NODE_1095_length_14602_cov_33.808867_8_plen_164_part_00
MRAPTASRTLSTTTTVGLDPHASCTTSTCSTAGLDPPNPCAACVSAPAASSALSTTSTVGLRPNVTRGEVTTRAWPAAGGLCAQVSAQAPASNEKSKGGINKNEKVTKTPTKESEEQPSKRASPATKIHCSQNNVLQLLLNFLMPLAASHERCKLKGRASRAA